MCKYFLNAFVSALAMGEFAENGMWNGSTCILLRGDSFIKTVFYPFIFLPYFLCVTPLTYTHTLTVVIADSISVSIPWQSQGEGHTIWKVAKEQRWAFVCLSEVTQASTCSSSYTAVGPTYQKEFLTAIFPFVKTFIQVTAQSIFKYPLMPK